MSESSQKNTFNLFCITVTVMYGDSQLCWNLSKRRYANPSGEEPRTKRYVRCLLSWPPTSRLTFSVQFGHVYDRDPPNRFPKITWSEAEYKAFKNCILIIDGAIERRYVKHRSKKKRFALSPLFF